MRENSLSRSRVIVSQVIPIRDEVRRECALDKRNRCATGWPKFDAESANYWARTKAWITDWAIPVTWRTWTTSDRGWTIIVRSLIWTTWITACSMVFICHSSRTWCSPPTCSEVMKKNHIEIYRDIENAMLISI